MCSVRKSLVIGKDLTVTGDPGGGTTIDASAGGRDRIFLIATGRTVRLGHLTLRGGDPEGGAGGAIMNLGDLTISDVS